MPPESPRWSVDELIPFGKYILLNKISAGATAAVYRAKIRGEAGFERLLTIKRILPQMAGDPEFVETFVREAKVCARLNHSSICPIYELGKVGESLYMAMEWVAGKDLGAIVRRLQYTGKVMPPLVAAWIVSRVCDALDYAHALKDTSGQPIGIVHQDLSPANIVISYEGQVKLIDFGLAKAAGRAQQTNVDALKQKIGYMSPELVLGVQLDARSDVFGVGVCLYEMVTGRRLFAGPDDVATLKLVSSATVPPPSALVDDTPEDLEMIMMRALERDPDKRWSTAGEMGSALTACIAADDPTFGTRHIAEFMRELFAQDMAAEQRRLNDLLAASQDPKVIEERRRFFSSPMGAAAIAKAEARRVVSTLPPTAAAMAAAAAAAAPKPALPAKPKTPPLPAIAADVDRPPPARPSLARPAPPPPAGLPPLPQTSPPLPAAKPDPSQTVGSDDEPTTYRADPEDEPTQYRADDAFENEMTTFRPERAASESANTVAPALPGGANTVAPALLGGANTVAPALSGAVTERPDPAEGPRPDDPPEERTPAAPLDYARSRVAAAAGFEDEATSYFDPDKRASVSWGAAKAAAKAQEPDTLSRDFSESIPDLRPSQPDYEEEATHIFFSNDSDAPAPEPVRPGPGLSRPIVDPAMRSDGVITRPENLRRRTMSEVRSRQPSGPSISLNAPANRSGRLWPLEENAASGTSGWPRTSARLERGPTIELPMMARLDRRAVIWISSAILLLTLIGIVVKTPVGIQLGLRKPSEGAIEVRTVPPSAAVRLDGIYRGRAPLRLEGVRVGERMLALEAEGYVTAARRVIVEGGNTASINVALEPQIRPAAGSR